MYAVYCQGGLDTAVHMSEETKRADRGAARNLIYSNWATALSGFALLLAILFSMQVDLATLHICSTETLDPMTLSAT